MRFLTFVMDAAESIAIGLKFRQCLFLYFHFQEKLPYEIAPGGS